MQRLLVTYLVKSIVDKVDDMTSKKPKKNPTFGNGDKRKATGQCRSSAQKKASNSRKKK